MQHHDESLALWQSTTLALKRERKGDVMVKKSKARVSEETLDEFLAQREMLGTCEDRAIKEIIAELLTEATKAKGITKTPWRYA